MTTQDNDRQIIGASWLLPMAATTSDTAALQDHAVLVDGATIRAIDSYSALSQQHPDAPAQFLQDHILMPGLINGHGHAGMSLLRGYSDDLPLENWLNDNIWPAESRWVNEDFVSLGTELAIAEMLLSGTTTVADMYFFPAETARIAETAGIRAQLTFPVIDGSDNWAVDADQHIARGLEARDQFKNSDLVTIGFGPHAPYTVSDRSFERIAVLADEIDAPVQLHLHETREEIETSQREHGHTPVQRLSQLGVLSARTQAVHLTHCSETDLQTLAESGCSVIHCPASNLKLGSGYCDIQKLLAAGIPVGLGTDSAASNNSLNSFDSIRLAALMAKHKHGAGGFTATEAIYAATQGGANALGIGQLTGSISVGKQADIIALSTLTPAFQPLHNPSSQLAYTDSAAQVQHVWVAGKQLVKNRELLSIDQQALIERVRHWQQSSNT